MQKSLIIIPVLALYTGCSRGNDASTTLADAPPTGHPSVTAGDCEIYVEKVEATPDSHGSGSITAVVRVPWLGGGEQVQSVGFYGHPQATDLGNGPGCDAPQFDSATFAIIAPGGNEVQTSPGEYEFDFPVLSGSVATACPGYHYSWIGAFFVETNQEIYWLNPSLDFSQNFVFDANGYQNIEAQSAAPFTLQPTTSGGLKYYNPLACTR